MDDGVKIGGWDIDVAFGGCVGETPGITGLYLAKCRSALDPEFRGHDFKKLSYWTRGFCI